MAGRTSFEFQYNHAFPDELGNDVNFRAFLLARGIDVRKNIRRELPSSYAHGLRVAPFSLNANAEVEGFGRETKCVVGTTWKMAPIIEWGTTTSPAYAPLRKATLATGMRFVEGGQ